MFEFVKIAWRNLWRNTRRTLIISFAIGLGIWGGIIAVAFDNAFVFQMMDNFIYTHLGHIQIHFKGYHKNPALRLCIAEPEKVLEAVKTVPGIKGYAPRIKSFGLAQSPRASQGVMLVGIDPELEPTVTRIKTFIRRGRFFQEAEERGVLIGEALAKKLRLELGDKLTIFSQGFASDEGVMESLRVVGIYKSGVSELDKTLVYLPLKTAERILEVEGKISEVAIVIEQEDKLNRVKNLLKEKLKPLRPRLGVREKELESSSAGKDKFLVFTSPDKNIILDPEIYEEAFKRNSSLEGITVRLNLPITALHRLEKGKVSSLNLSLVGIDPLGEEKVSGIFSKVELAPDSWLWGTELEKELEVNQDWVILSEPASKKLNARPGEKISFDTGDKILELEVVGIIKDFPGAGLGEDFALVHRQRIFKTFINRPAGSEIWARLNPEANPEQVKQELLGYLDFEVLDWGELYPVLAQLYSLMNAANYVLLLVIYIAVAFGIANTMIMSVFERVRELGILKAVGTRPAQLFGLIIIESIFLAILGMVIGAIASGITIGLWARSGLDLSMFATGMEALGLGTVLYPVLTFENILGAVVMAVLITIISAIYPALRASRLLVVEALRRF